MTKAQKFQVLPIADIKPDPKQPRKYFDPKALKELADSIKTHGVLQPLIVRKDDKGQTILVAGERRFKAAKKAELTKVPVCVLVSDDHAEVALVENLLREDLTAVEEAEAIKRLQDERGYELPDLVRVLGKGKSTISEIVSLTKLPEEIRKECRKDPTVSRRRLVEIAKHKTEKGMLGLYKRMKAQGLTSNELRERTRSKNKPKPVVITHTIETMLKQLGKLKDQTLTAGQKKALGESLGGLKVVIDETLEELKG